MLLFNTSSTFEVNRLNLTNAIYNIFFNIIIGRDISPEGNDVEDLPSRKEDETSNDVIIENDNVDQEENADQEQVEDEYQDANEEVIEHDEDELQSKEG